ncbi:M1 family metallopeptidase [Antarcticibacterium flavum]|uniref:M1 family metallopeptidase n=1 Tax=Antarcticibacterium flavum TaxID=2058175 RepID=A0A5B7X6L7_9FLAO|nr:MULTISPECIES: M1 family metallopeptidase [Antarcticibacterium]MCM4158526.1 peptidase M1 [Antarcticibacterium sp. W02-3]QCY70273.1 M1 family metallopeptidase [Antarcticibacterium flavum]
MNYLSKVTVALAFMITGIPGVQGQEVRQTNQDVFNEFTYRQGNTYRTASGRPGPDYWQNAADYNIEATLNDEAHTLTGKITVTYTNNSPEDLEFIWMYLEQNRFREDSRGSLTTPIQGNRYDGDVDGGYTINNLQAKVKRSTSSKYIIDDTRMQVFFEEPITANGGKATISMDFEYKIPVEGMDRMGRLDVGDGTIYAMAQWFPQVAVLDDVVGWNVEPYLGAGEFYYDYGTFEYKITAPFDHIVVGSGALLNPRQVLSPKVRERMEQASRSDSTVYLIRPEEVNDPSIRAKQEGTLTWHFKIENSRDVAFASSKAFIWDAAKIDLPSGRKAMAQSAYPKESDGQDAWSRSTEYSKASVEHYSEKWYEYPWPVAVNVAADIGGMEYPGLNFCSWQSKGASLWGVTDHEFGHNWFPMIVGSNERRYAWMDEGFNTFINHYSTLDFNNGEYPSRLNRMRNMTGWFLNPNREGIDTYPDVANLQNLGMIAYYKPAMGLFLLREYILGEERFDNAFRSYIKAWAFKHPQPNDFFNHMENVAGENLDWFWKGWFYGTGNIDIAIDGVQSYQGNYVISLSNRGDIPMPVEMRITYSDGDTEDKRLPVEIWQRGNSWNYLLRTDKQVQSVELDPEKVLPDVNFSNDAWPGNFYQER